MTNGNYYENPAYYNGFNRARIEVYVDAYFRTR